MRNLAFVYPIIAVILQSSWVDGRAEEQGHLRETPLRTIGALRDEMEIEEDALLESLRECDKRLKRYQQLPPDARTREGGLDAFRAQKTKLKAIRALAFMRSREGLEYMSDNLFYIPAGPQRNRPGVFRNFPCAAALAGVDEVIAVRGVIRLVRGAELNLPQQVFCAHFLHHIARNPDRKNALGKNLLLKEVEELEGKVEMLRQRKGDWAQSPMQDLQILRRNVDSILSYYDQIIDDGLTAKQEFSAARVKMHEANRLKWKGEQP